jgi:hypothetical protein
MASPSNPEIYQAGGARSGCCDLVARRTGELGGPRRGKWRQCLPERQHALDAAVRRQLDDGFASRAHGAIGADDRTAYACAVEKDVQSRVEHQAATGPVLVEAGDLFRDLLMARKHALGAPDLGIGRHRCAEELKATTFIVLGEGLVVRPQDSEELRLVHRNIYDGVMLSIMRLPMVNERRIPNREEGTFPLSRGTRLWISGDERAQAVDLAAG